ncbi:MAG TPA: MFS transporter [Intrasporangium sp.]|uniref:MFS transporter n=1 Tax=Intrasporangium sp. TaxID=1925024 RepID=UPI002B485885|nr:MFS transporter [Intrasporangium sp.]HKX68296.1 MFS transporter [Intrasporangium sp.]
MREPTGGYLPAGAPARPRWWLVVAMALATYLAMLDMTVVTVALPILTEDFRTTPAVSEWLILAYLLPLVGFSLPAGRWVDTAPWRASLQVSLVGFAGSSVLVALSSSVGFAIAGRAVQGLFAALLFSLAPAVASTAVPPSSRGRAMSVIATVGPLGAVSGYAAGAFILDSFGWRWTFYLNLPIAAAVLAIVLAVMPADDRVLRLPSPDLLVEGTTLLLAAGTLLTGLSLAASRGLPWLALSLTSVLPLATWRLLEPGRRAIDRLSEPSVRQPHLSLLLETAAFGAASFVLPFLLGAIVGGSARTVGLTLLALPLASIVGSAVGGLLADRSTPRAAAVLGATVLSAGLAVLTAADTSWGPTDYLWGIALVGSGAGSFAGANQAIAMTAAAPGDAASTGASTNVARQLGFAVGPAVGTTVWAVADYGRAGLAIALALASAGSLAAAFVLIRQPRQVDAAQAQTTPRPTTKERNPR